MWKGGCVPLGCDAIDRKLVINRAEAENVRAVFELFARSESTAAVRELDARGIRSRRGRPLDRASLYKLLHNRICRGEITHKGAAYPGAHEAIISQTGAAMTPHHTRRKGKRYCCHTSMDVIRGRPKAELRGPQRLPAAMVEGAVIAEVRRMPRTPEIAARTARAQRIAGDVHAGGAS